MRMVRLQQGVTLIEAMVAFLVISIGLLGIAALQASGMRYNVSSAQRSLATINAETIMNMMKANICGVHDATQADAHPNCNPATSNAHVYAGGVPAAAPAELCQSLDTTVTPPATPCTPAEQALADLWLWSRQVARSLPGGTAALTCLDAPCTNTSFYQVSISWSERSGGATAVRTFTTVFRP